MESAIVYNSLVCNTLDVCHATTEIRLHKEQLGMRKIKNEAMAKYIHKLEEELEMRTIENEAMAKYIHKLQEELSQENDKSTDEVIVWDGEDIILRKFY